MKDTVTLFETDDTLIKELSAGKLRGLFSERANKIFRQDLGKACNIENILLRVQGGELPPELWQGVDELRRNSTHSGVKPREKASRSGANDGEINEVVCTHARKVNTFGGVGVASSSRPPVFATSFGMKIYTKTGDDGNTGLFGGGRVEKDHPRVEAYGDVDELNAALGMARAVELMPRIDEVLVPIQRDLFSIGALLATPNREKMHEQLSKARIDDERIAELERAIDLCERELPPLRAFIIPGGTPKAGALHVARTVCRRAERRVVTLSRDVELPELVVIYLNRLSDLLFMLARVANVRAGAGEVTW